MSAMASTELRALVGGRSEASRLPVDAPPWAMALEERLLATEHHQTFGQAIDRQRSARMLFVGSLSGFLGFLFALIIGIIQEQTEGKFNKNGQPFASGRGYFPATVSEMVHNPLKPEGKTFFAFCFVGAVFIFFSHYPWHLRNVYIGDDALCCCGISWISFRQYIPAPGMMLLAIVTTTPGPQATAADHICVILHLVGAAMLFVGYFICEANCVGWRCCRRSRYTHDLHEEPRALRQRKFCLTIIAVSYVTFLVLQVVLSVKNPLIRPEEDDVWGHLEGHVGNQLLNTAHWKVKSLKVLSYASEVVCGLSLITSHLVIWYYCEERNYDLPEELDTLTQKLNRIPNQRSRLIADSEMCQSMVSESSEDSQEAAC